VTRTSRRREFFPHDIPALNVSEKTPARGAPKIACVLSASLITIALLY
jgi:hypothetical protein